MVQNPPKGLLLHRRIDLRPVINSDRFKLSSDTPRLSTESERQLFGIKTEDASIYKYISVRRDVTIVQFFAADHCYLGGGEYETTDNEQHALSEADLSRIANVVQF